MTKKDELFNAVAFIVSSMKDGELVEPGEMAINFKKFIEDGGTAWKTLDWKEKIKVVAWIEKWELNEEAKA